MNKFIAIVISVLMLVGLSLAGCGNDVVSTINNNPKVYVATGHPEWWPVMYRDTDKIAGLGADVLALIGNDINVAFSCEYEGNWENAQQLVRDGNVDMLVAAYKTDERQQYYDFSEAYITDPVALFVTNQSGMIYSQWSDLIGKKGVAMSGDSYGNTFDQYIATNLTVERVGTVAEALAKLSNGEADYFVYAYYSGVKAIADYPGQYKDLSPYIAEENFYIAISKKSSLVNYLPQINTAIQKYKTDGTINKLLEKYLQ
jgi:polar amino acid transport system substrate-binding protein